MNSPTRFASLAAITVSITAFLSGPALGQTATSSGSCQLVGGVRASAPAGTPAQPTLRTSKEVYAPGEPITVMFENLPAAGKGTDWLSLAREDHPANRYNAHVYLRGRTSGTHQFSAQAAGRYDVRAYFDWPRGRYNAQLCVPVVVAAEPSGASKPAPLPPPATAAPPVQESQPPRAQEPTSAVAAGLPEPGLAGSWLAYVGCAQGGTRRGVPTRTIPAFLDVREGGLTADLYVVEWYAPAVRMTGSYDAQARRVSLQAKEWIYPSRTVTEPPALRATLDDSGLGLQGEIVLRPKLEECASFRAFKFVRDRRPTNPKGLLAAFPDNRGAANMRDEKLCKDFLTWNVEGSVSQTQGKSIPSQLVDGDSFYRAMGKPYDQWTDSDERVFQGLLTGCRNTFQGSSNIEHTSLLAKERTTRHLAQFLNPGVPDKPDQRRHFTYLERYALVVALRNARLHADFRVSEAKSLRASRENRDRIASTAGEIDKGVGVFVALEKEEARRYVEALNGQRERLVNDLGKSALAEAETEIGKIRATADPLKQLAALKSVHRGESTYHDLLLPGDRRALESRIVDEQRVVAKRAIESTMTQLEATPPDGPAALKRIEELGKTLEPTLLLLVNSVDQEYRSRIRKKHDDTLATLIGQRVALLDTYPAGKKGLEQSARWPADLHATFGAHQSSSVFAQAMNRYSQSRNKLLKDSHPEFEAAVRGKGAAAVEKIRRQYLSWDGDDKLKAASEYLTTFGD